MWRGGEHATALFKSLRFSFLNERTLNEAVEGNSNEKLGEILHQDASEFTNNITPPRIYNKGLYILGFKTSKLIEAPVRSFVRYCPDDGNIVHLQPPRSEQSKFASSFDSKNTIAITTSQRTKSSLQNYDFLIKWSSENLKAPNKHI